MCHWLRRCHLCQFCDSRKTSVKFVPVDGSEHLNLLVNGEPEQVDEERASEILQNEDLIVEINLGTNGGQSADF